MKSLGILFSLLFFMLLSCSGNKVTRTDYESSLKLYNTQKEELVYVCNLFSKQDNLFSIVRTDQRKLAYYSLFFENCLSYSLTSIDLHQQTFEIPNEYKDTEEEFWKKGNIKVLSTSNVSLAKFLEMEHIPDSTFNELRNFLTKTGFYSISKITRRSYIEISIDVADGFIFNPAENEIPIMPSATEIKKLDKNWYYFREYK